MYCKLKILWKKSQLQNVNSEFREKVIIVRYTVFIFTEDKFNN